LPLHNLGKFGVPDTILQESGPLTQEEEWAVIYSHPELGP
jgi:response regulator RpfG family c-di-GMP phosphodiesterase